MDLLPLELLHNIFTWSCDLNTPLFFQGCPSITDETEPCCCNRNNEAALRLSRVCSRWRNITLSRPELWSRVTIREHIDELTVERISRIRRFVQLYLTRSETTPLDIIVEFVNLANTFSDFEFSAVNLYTTDHNKCMGFLPVFQLFFKESTRWRNACLSLNKEVLQQHRMSGWPLEFTVLKQLRIHVAGKVEDDNGTRAHLPISAVSAPVLELIHHTGIEIFIGVDVDDDHYGPLPSLEFLTVSSVSYRDTLALASPKTSVTVVEGVELTPGIICLAGSFRISPLFSIPGELSLGRAIECLTLPCVSKIHLEPTPSRDIICYAIGFSCEGFRSLLGRSSASLVTHFTCIGILVTDAELLDILNLLPSLTHLAFGEPSIAYAEIVDEEDFVPLELPSLTWTNTLCMSLTYKGNRSVVRRLRELHLAFAFGSDFKQRCEAIFQMIDSRIGLPENDDHARLQVVHLLVPTMDDNHGVIARVEELRVVGLQCELEWVETIYDWSENGLGFPKA